MRTAKENRRSTLAELVSADRPSGIDAALQLRKLQPALRSNFAVRA
jgi:hypothetical protein